MRRTHLLAMYSFMNDYSEGVHPRILKAISESNFEQHTGYGLDSDCMCAKEIIREMIEQPTAEVFFVSGGTQCNLIALNAIMRPWEAVIATQLGHIFTLEAGAIEAGGHKVISVPTTDGKMNPDDVRNVVAHSHSDYVEQPKVVYISNCTELGTIYTKAELTALSQTCHELGLYLFMDGARMGSAMTCVKNDLTFPDIARLTDMFYIGGTKCGAMFGEAMVIPNKELQPHMRCMIRQRGALLAKGWMLGIQFKELLRDGLYFDLASHANATAQILRDGITECDLKLITSDPTNQFYMMMPNEILDELKKEFVVYEWSKDDPNQTLIRLTTSWATVEEECHRFVALLKRIVADVRRKESRQMSLKNSAYVGESVDVQ